MAGAPVVFSFDSISDHARREDVPHVSMKEGTVLWKDGAPVGVAGAQLKATIHNGWGPPGAFIVEKTVASGTEVPGTLRYDHYSQGFVRVGDNGETVQVKLDVESGSWKAAVEGFLKPKQIQVGGRWRLGPWRPRVMGRKLFHPDRVSGCCGEPKPVLVSQCTDPEGGYTIRLSQSLSELILKELHQKGMVARIGDVVSVNCLIQVV